MSARLYFDVAAAAAPDVSAGRSRSRVASPIRVRLPERSMPEVAEPRPSRDASEVVQEMPARTRGSGTSGPIPVVERRSPSAGRQVPSAKRPRSGCHGRSAAVRTPLTSSAGDRNAAMDVLPPAMPAAAAPPERDEFRRAFAHRWLSIRRRVCRSSSRRAIPSTRPHGSRSRMNRSGPLRSARRSVRPNLVRLSLAQPSVVTPSRARPNVVTSNIVTLSVATLSRIRWKPVRFRRAWRSRIRSKSVSLVRSRCAPWRPAPVLCREPGTDLHDDSRAVLCRQSGADLFRPRPCRPRS